MKPEELVQKIIEDQGQIIGEELALHRAVNTGLIKKTKGTFELKDKPKVVIDKLISAYEEIFGESSVKVCVSTLEKFVDCGIDSYLPSNVKSLLESA